MKILLSSYVFPPSVGGIEAVAVMLAEEFVAAGHDLKVVTHTLDDGNATFPYEVIRQPRALPLIRLVGWPDVVLHVNISLHTGWPLLFRTKPWVISHHSWVPKNVRGFVKRRCTLAAHNISVSHAVAQSLDAPSVVIPNPYDEGTFQERTNSKPDRDLIFVGRLVTEKGVDCALKALRLLKEGGIAPNFTVVGKGPDESRLRQLTAELGLDEQVKFVGLKRGEELASEFARHRILVVPSTSDEPFGVVALEGIASGCVVIGSEGGGLKDAIGPCGMTFPNRNVSSLASCLRELLADTERFNGYRQHAKKHLAGFSRPLIAQKYLDVMQSASSSSRTFMTA
jgi:glycosyltransferase involved in cell wall biosynthesis